MKDVSKAIFKALLFGVTCLTATHALADAPRLILQLDYRLFAGINYQSGLTPVVGGPIQTSEISFRVSGSRFCNVLLSDVQYNTAPNAPLRLAQPVASNAVYTVAAGSLYSLNVQFKQYVYSGVDCSLLVYADNGSNPSTGGQEELVGVLSYSGGFVDKATLTLPSPLSLKSFRLAIPAFCGQVDVLEGGSVTEGVYDRGQATATAAEFEINGGAGQRVSALVATLNGPTTSVCSIPVYAVSQ